MCIVPSLQSQLESHSSLHTVQTPAHLVWQLQGDLHALTKIHTCTRKCWHKNKHKHTAAHKVPWYPKAHNLLADHAFIVETGLSGWSALKCERLHTFSTQSHTHTQDSHKSTVLFCLWFTGHFTPSWGGHLQRWPCTAAQGHRYSILQHFLKNSPSTEGSWAVNLHLWRFNLSAWRSKMHSSFHITQSLYSHSQFSKV